MQRPLFTALCTLSILFAAVQVLLVMIAQFLAAQYRRLKESGLSQSGLIPPTAVQTKKDEESKEKKKSFELPDSFKQGPPGKQNTTAQSLRPSSRFSSVADRNV